MQSFPPLPKIRSSPLFPKIRSSFAVPCSMSLELVPSITESYDDSGLSQKSFDEEINSIMCKM